MDSKIPAGRGLLITVKRVRSRLAPSCVLVYKPITSAVPLKVSGGYDLARATKFQRMVKWRKAREVVKPYMISMATS